MYKDDWIRMYNFDLCLHTEHEVIQDADQNKHFNRIQDSELNRFIETKNDHGEFGDEDQRDNWLFFVIKKCREL